MIDDDRRLLGPSHVTIVKPVDPFAGRVAGVDRESAMFHAVRTLLSNL